MGSPTIYKTPRKSIDPKSVKSKDKHLWEKHRASKDKNTSLPKMKK